MWEEPGGRRNVAVNKKGRKAIVTDQFMSVMTKQTTTYIKTNVQ